MRSVLVAIFLALVSLAVSAPAPDGQNTITVQFTIRDHVGLSPPTGGNKTTHNDFERANGEEKGVVLSTLGADRKPVFNTGRVSSSWTNQTLFDYVWRDTPGVNINLIRNFILTWNTQTNLYEYSNSSFFPIDYAGYGNYANNHNFHFCLEYHTQFTYKGNELFSFTGDDDVYFFVNNVLFVDLGGVHGAQSLSKNLTNTAAAKSQYNMDVGGVYNFDFFYCERHTTASNLKMATNIQLNNCPFLDRCGACAYVVDSGVNPCNTKVCNNGLCSCANDSCICNAGWINGPTTFCSQKCGDGIIQGNEQCDGGACCTSTCTFATSGTSCAAQGIACIQNICPGNSATCGVPLAIGSTCNGGSTAPTCKQYQCTKADGTVCALTNNDALTCSDNNACTTDTCSSGTCMSTTATTCPATICRNAGTCSSSSGQCSVGSAKANGIGCGADPGTTVCVQPTCVSGSCSNTSKPIGTSCGSDTLNKCGTSQCNGQGSCATIPIASATGTAANCATFVAGTCTRQICDPTGNTVDCVSQNIQDGTSCTSGTPAMQCQRAACANGVCTLVADNEGEVCTDGPSLNNYGDDSCKMTTCQAGACKIVVNSARSSQSCNILSSGANPEAECRTYTCNAGNCTQANTNEAKTCITTAQSPTPSPSNAQCNQLLCASGTCSITASNAGGQCQNDAQSNCTFYRCDSAGACVANVTARADLSCDPSNKCSPKFCDISGMCVAKPVVCTAGSCGSPACEAASGTCVLTNAPNCCGNNVLETNAGEECDNTSDPCCVACKWAAVDYTCGTAQCAVQTCQLKQGGGTQCTDNYTPKNNLECTNGPPVTTQCQQLRCLSGDCIQQSMADDVTCVLPTGFCNKAVCRAGACALVAKLPAGTDCSSAYGTVPECNKAECSDTQCVLNSASFENMACVGLDATTCSTRQCKSGLCQYSYTGFPNAANAVCAAELSTTNLCLLPGCNGAGGCVFQNAAVDTECDVPSNPQCNIPRCDNSGTCQLKPINPGMACDTARDLQCQIANCSNGDCVVTNVTENTPCQRTDVGQCQDAVCQSGACVLVSTPVLTRACTVTSTVAPGGEDRSCFNYFCQSDGSCNTPVPKDNGTACTDGNLCDADLCQGGTCVHTPSTVCNTPTLPCEVPLGICQTAYGNCTYGGRGQYASCSPRDSELDARCNASVIGAYRCATGAADSSCVPSCFSGGVCGDGIIQAGEECDWGDDRTGGPCCNITNCQWFSEQSPCNNTDPVIIAAVTAQTANLSAAADLPSICFNTRCFLSSSGRSVCTLGYDETADNKCVPSSNNSSNRTAILASVIPGALLALCLAGAGFYFWRRAQSAAEGAWLQEYLNAGNVRVENNAAFVETQTNVNNAAFQPDGSN